MSKICARWPTLPLWGFDRLQLFKLSICAEVFYISCLLPPRELHLHEVRVQLALFATSKPGCLVVEKLKRIYSVIRIERCPFHKGSLSG